nr:MAG TPA: hypothetical protein [Caudoviricetes sp.]
MLFFYWKCATICAKISTVDSALLFKVGCGCGVEECKTYGGFRSN